MSCRDFFIGLPSDGQEIKKRAELIESAFPDGICQAESVSASSSGTVKGEEFVHRFVFSPVHVNPDGSLKTAFFSDCNTFGLSCQRSAVEIATPEIHALGSKMIDDFNAGRPTEKPERSYLGVVSANCDNVRMLRLADGSMPSQPKSGMMAIYDTGLPENPEHVDVFQIHHGLKDYEIKQARRDLALVFTRTPVYA